MLERIREKPLLVAVGVAATVSVAVSAIGWVTFVNNLNAYKHKWRERDRRSKRATLKGKRPPEEPYQTWCREFCDDWDGEDLVVALEASCFPKGGSYVALKMNPKPLKKEDKVRSISFAGGGFRTISYVGQLIYLEKRGLIAKGQTRFYGASLGALVATGMILGETDTAMRRAIIQGMLEYVCEVYADWTGMWGICGIATRGVLERALPDDVSALNGRLFISVTVLTPWPHSVLVSEFANKQDLIETLLASQFIPGWTHGLLPFKLWRGRPALDGGIFDNIPTPAVGGGEEAREMFGILSLRSMRETFARPTLRRADGHFTCRDPDAPVAQVLRPPRGEQRVVGGVGGVEDAVFEEVRRGYLGARTAVKAELKD